MADKIFYLNPELGYYLPKSEFLPYASVEISDIGVAPPSTTGTVRIVHAPTADKIKGTPAILAALESLKGKYDFEVILVRKMAHDEALQVYRSADLVIDQALAGWYGGFAVEAMAMGKPVLCYLREEDFPNVPKAMIADLPIHNIRPGRIAKDIAEALDRRAEWPEWSKKARSFVEKWHNPSTIAASMMRIYEDPSRPAGWMTEDWK
jgi:glycosyltransferase involved in cell wall biosynthesis